MILSILICTIPERSESFKKLHSHLTSQLDDNKVEILFDPSPKGTITIGAKRNALLKKAKGKYVCFVDDDDSVNDNYVTSIRYAATFNPDCIGFKIDCNMDGVKKKAISSLKYKDWQSNIDGYDYVRSIYHKTPVKREIALNVGFPDKSFSEDHEYSMGIQPYLKSHYFIDEYLYYYNYKSENHKTKYGLK